MITKDLIKALQTKPPTAQVLVMYDGSASRHAELVWLSRAGKVILSAYNEPVYDDKDRPTNAPTTEQDRYWSTQECPEDEYDLDW